MNCIVFEIENRDKKKAYITISSDDHNIPIQIRDAMLKGDIGLIQGNLWRIGAFPDRLKSELK
jgi:hypothetical protein